MAAQRYVAVGRHEDARTAATRVTPALKRALITEAERQNASVNDVAVGAVARHYRVAFLPSGQRPATVADPDKLDLVLRMPRRIKKRIERDALESGANIMDTIERVLSEEFRVALEQPTEP